MHRCLCLHICGMLTTYISSAYAKCIKNHIFSKVTLVHSSLWATPREKPTSTNQLFTMLINNSSRLITKIPFPCFPSNTLTIRTQVVTRGHQGNSPNDGNVSCSFPYAGVYCTRFQNSMDFPMASLLRSVLLLITKRQTSDTCTWLSVCFLACSQRQYIINFQVILIYGLNTFRVKPYLRLSFSRSA